MTNNEFAGSRSGDPVHSDETLYREEVHGDTVLQDKVLGDKITQYIFQGLADAAARYKQFTELEKQPYLPDRPFTPLERPLFTGREEEIRDILRYLGDAKRQTVVIYGAPDVGKTSLLAAGIIPGLSIVGAVPLLLQDYANPAAVLKREILTQAAVLGLALDDNDPAQLVQQLVNRSGQGVVLIFDQFERAFLPGSAAEMRDELRRLLSGIIASVPPRYLHTLIAIREDLQFELDPPWRDILPGLGQSIIYLEGLAIDEARNAIELPEKLAREDPQLFPPFYYDRESAVVNELILPELDQLSNLEEKLILPADLQIVCYRLYEAAQKKEIPTIDHQLYWQVSHDKGAAYIIDDHFRKLMASIPQAYQDPARTVSQAMLDDVDNFWSTAESIGGGPGALTGAVAGATALSLKEIQTTLEEMVRAGLLISHESGGQPAYAFAGNSIANAAARAAGPEYEKKLEARKQVNAIWRAWVIYDALASKGQLRLVEQYSPENDPLNVLLYLRSAVAQGLPVTPWLERLQNPEARQLLRRIEEQSVEDPGQSGAVPRRHRAEDLLGLLDQEIPPRPPEANAGPLTWAAAAHPHSAVVRETAVLALLAAYTGPEGGGQQRDALDRVESLWQEDLISRERMAELLGILSNADHRLAKSNKKRPFADRYAIWRWRFRRLFTREKHFILTLTGGGALGVGLGLGILRALIAIFIPYRSGDALFFYTPNGFFLGAALTFGVLLTNVVRLKESDPQREVVEKRPLLPTLLMGGLFFALMHIFLGLILSVGLIKAPLAHLMSFFAGAALAQVIYDQPQAGWRGRTGVWLLRFALAAAVFALIHFLLFTYDEQGYSLQFAWSGFFYRQQLLSTFEEAGFTALLNLDNWFHYFAFVDAALSGLAMALGLAVGLLLADRWYRNWLALKILAGE